MSCLLLLKVKSQGCSLFTVEVVVRVISVRAFSWSANLCKGGAWASAIKSFGKTSDYNWKRLHKRWSKDEFPDRGCEVRSDALTLIFLRLKNAWLVANLQRICSGSFTERSRMPTSPLERSADLCGAVWSYGGWIRCRWSDNHGRNRNKLVRRLIMPIKLLTKRDRLQVEVVENTAKVTHSGELKRKGWAHLSTLHAEEKGSSLPPLHFQSSSGPLYLPTLIWSIPIQGAEGEVADLLEEEEVSTVRVHEGADQQRCWMRPRAFGLPTSCQVQCSRTCWRV